MVFFNIVQAFEILPLFNRVRAQPTSIYLLKDNNRNIRTSFEIRSKLKIKTPERRQWRCSGVFIVNFENISYFVLLFLLLTLNM